MRNRVMACLGLLALTMLAEPGKAQFMYLDSNADRASSIEDRLSAGESTAVDVWISTDKRRDGRGVQRPDPNGRALTINSYEVILKAVGGTVEWGSFTNHLDGADVKLGPLKSATEFYVFRGGLKQSPPGNYKLCTVVVYVKSGKPRLVVGERTALWPAACTSFGSNYHGYDNDNTLKFTEDPAKLGMHAEDVPRDWADANGLDAADGAAEQVAALPASQPRVFTTRVSPNPANPEATISITTTRSGFLRVRIFDVAGRLVRELINKESVPPGLYEAKLSGSNAKSLSSGLYFFRVEASEATRSGKLVILK